MLAIKSLKGHKHLGLNGFSATYFKKLKDLLAPILVRAFNATHFTLKKL